MSTDPPEHTRYEPPNEPPNEFLGRPDGTRASERPCWPTVAVGPAPRGPADAAPPARPGPTRRRVLAAVGAVGVAWAGALATNRVLRSVDGPSMLPLLAPHDLLLTLPTNLVTPRRGDVVVLAPGAVGPTAAVKRLVGLPDDRVVMLDGHVHVDGSWWDVPGAVLVDEDHVVPAGPDEVVVLGDNRAASTDSRGRGAVPLATVERVALARVGPWTGLRHGTRRLVGPRVRPAVRVVVLDPDDRTLLFRVADVDGVLDDWWETPGGGLQPGEDQATAAVREVAEEVGADVAVVDLGHVAERDSVLYGAPLHRVESTWAARVPDDTVRTDDWTASERIDHRGWRWFTRDEVAALDDVTHPVDLLEVHDRAVRALTERSAEP